MGRVDRSKYGLRDVRVTAIFFANCTPACALVAPCQVLQESDFFGTAEDVESSTVPFDVVFPCALFVPFSTFFASVFCLFADFVAITSPLEDRGLAHL